MTKFVLDSMTSFGPEVNYLLHKIDFVILKLCLDVSYFKRMYAAKWSTWKYEQTIVKEGNAYRISGISKLQMGPQKYCTVMEKFTF